MKYNLDVLNDKEFEDLCKDLLDITYEVNFQIFKAGKDDGIDLLYSKKTENEIVVQVKHYVTSTFAQLKQKLINDELGNIKKMSPTPLRYVVATSLPLSPKQAKEIKDILSPFVRSTNDVYGRRRLESILSKNAHLEEKYFKLWLTSTNVLKRILNNAAITNSDFHKTQILFKTKRYVMTDDFPKAVEMLTENKFLIISGQPGVGKTSLAYMLICERLSAGCELFFSDGKISEIEGLLSHDSKKKQIFFVDDFLGANLYDIRNPKNAENKIISFVSKIQAFPNKYLVFTSRTTILNQANHRFESLRRSRLTIDSKYELELGSYSALNKGKILYNHLFFGVQDSGFILPFFKKEVYTSIIKHKNFFPRLIEFITDARHFNTKKFPNVVDFVFHQLDHPEEIWKHAYEEQLEDEDRFLVMSLFSLGGAQVVYDSLETAFAARYDYEIANNNVHRKPQAYRNALKKLLDGFIQASQLPDGQNLYSFLNPSITDYLLVYLKVDKEEQKAILSSIAFIDQLFIYFGNDKDKINIDSKMSPRVYRSIISRLDEIGLVKPGSCPLFLLDTILEIFPLQISSDLSPALELMKDILENPSGVSSFTLSVIICQNDLYDRDLLNNFAKENLYQFIDIIVDCAKAGSDLEFLKEIFDQFSLDFKDYIDHGENKGRIENKLSEIFETLAKDIDFDEGHILEMVAEKSKEAAETSIESDIWEEYVQFIQSIHLDDYFDEFEHSYDVSAKTIVEHAVENADYDDDEDRNYRSSLTPDYEKKSDEWDDIDRLFS